MRTPSGNCGLETGGRGRARDIMALNRSVVGKFSQVADTGELPSNTNDVNSVREHPRSPARSRQKKGAEVLAYFVVRRAPRTIGPAGMHRSTRECSKDACLCGKVDDARPDRDSLKFRQMSHRESLMDCSRERRGKRCSRYGKASRRAWNLIQNRATRSLICRHYDDIFSASNFASHFNTATSSVRRKSFACNATMSLRSRNTFRAGK